MTGMGSTLVDEMALMITTGQPAVPRSQVSTSALRARRAPIYELYTTADVEPPSSRDAAWLHGGGWTQGRRNAQGGAWKACRKPSENQNQLGPRGWRNA